MSARFDTTSAFARAVKTLLFFMKMKKWMDAVRIVKTDGYFRLSADSRISQTTWNELYMEAI